MTLSNQFLADFLAGRVTSAAISRWATTCFVVIGIGFIEWMTVAAMCFCAVLHHPALNVYGVAHGFKVIGIGTTSNAAQMVQGQSVRDWATEKLVGETVSRLKLAFEGKHPVTVSIDAPHPNPATGFGDHENVAHELFDRIGKGILIVSHCDFPQVTLVRAGQRLRDAVRPVSIIGLSQFPEFRKLNKI